MIDEIAQDRPKTIPSGKYADVQIAALTNDDLMHVRREFGRSDRPVQGAIMAEMSARSWSLKARLLKKMGRRAPRAGATC